MVMAYEELELFKQKILADGYIDTDDYIRKNKDRLTEHQIRLLNLIGFKF